MDDHHMDGPVHPGAVSLLDPAAQPRFVNPLPLPPVIDALAGLGFTMRIVRKEQWLGLVDPLTGAPLGTTVWGYVRDGVDPDTVNIYPGPTILAFRDAPVTVTWRNDLPLDGHLLPVDHTLHMAHVTDHRLVPVVTHLHGGHTSAQSDGLPEAWWTQDLPDDGVAGPAETGATFDGTTFTYENGQQAASLWYHDHALGITRLNVHAGLAGFYLLKDGNEQSLVDRGALPGRAYEVGLAIQDRAFTADGKLHYPAFPGDPLPGGAGVVEEFILPGEDEPISPTALPEFFGDHIVVNGMAWPVMEVDPGYWRFHLLNGSDSRFYWLEFSDPRVRAWMLGGDGGLLSGPIRIMDGDGVQEAGERLILAPGDRIDLLVDFRALRGQDVTLLNFGPDYGPFKGLDHASGALAGAAEGTVTGARADPGSDTAATVGQVMQFQVAARNADPGNDRLDIAALRGGGLNPDFERLLARDADNLRDIRKLGLFEMMDAAGRMKPMLGLAEDQGAERFGPRMWSDPVTERIRLGDTEIWEIHNFTEDAHPVHLHLVQFQVLGRYASTPLDRDGDEEADAAILGPRLDLDPARPGVQNLFPEDRGWQDTVWVGPGEAVRIIAEFDRAGEYVWHCHILSHEDNEMMRPFVVHDPATLIG